MWNMLLIHKLTYNPKSCTLSRMPSCVLLKVPCHDENDCDDDVADDNNDDEGKSVFGHGNNFADGRNT